MRRIVHTMKAHAETISAPLFFVLLAIAIIYTFTDPFMREFLKNLFDHHCAPGQVCL